MRTQPSLPTGERPSPLSAAATVDEEGKKKWFKWQVPTSQSLISYGQQGKLILYILRLPARICPAFPTIYVCPGVLRTSCSDTRLLTQPRCKTAPFACFVVRQQKSPEFPVFHPKARLCAHTEPGRGVSPVQQQHVVAWLPSLCGAARTVTSSHAFTKPLTFCPLNRCFWAPAWNGLTLCLAGLVRAPVNP